jgi:23S rRNA pseudouridine1911/1915/1917 synthase
MPCFSHVIEEQILRSVRLDRYVSETLRLLSRSQIKARDLKAKINGKDVKNSRIVKQGDILELSWQDSPPVNIIPQDIPLEIIYEDENCVVINKAQGMVVHPGAGNRQDTLANALYFRRLNRGGKEQPEETAVNVRPGIVHRLDKDTSGIIIAAYNEETLAFLTHQFKTRKTRKNYIAIVTGTPKEINGRIETYIARDPKDRKKFTVSADGRNAVTYYKVIKSWRSHSLLLLRPRTGRTHQLRVHLRWLGNPILGDAVYGAADKLFPEVSLMLHSKNLAITLPLETEQRIFSSEMPLRFNEVIEKLDRMNTNG